MSISLKKIIAEVKAYEPELEAIAVLAWPVLAVEELKGKSVVPTAAAVAAAYGLTGMWPWQAVDTQTFVTGYLGAGVAFVLASEGAAQAL